MTAEDDTRQPSQRIADEILLGVVSGDIEPGAQLPSTMALVEAYGVANQTVQNAMRLLKDEGLIYTVKGQGTFVRTDIDPKDFEGSVSSAGSPLFRQILGQLEVIGGEISAIKDRLDQIEKDRQSDPGD